MAITDEERREVARWAAGCAERVLPLFEAIAPADAAAMARELTWGAGAAAADDEVRWAIEHASPAIRDLVRRIPAGVPGRRRVDDIQRQLDGALR